MLIRKFLLIVVLLLLGIGRVCAEPLCYSIPDNSEYQLYSVDIATGDSTLVGPLGFTGDFEALAIDPTSGTLYSASDGDSLYSINTSTGAATLIGSLGVDYNNGGMAFDASGQGFLITNEGLYSFDKTTGTASFIGYDDIELSGGSFVGNTLYGTGENGSTGNLESINTSTGAITSVGGLGFLPAEQTGLCYDAVTDTLYMLDEDTRSFYAVNYNTGAATLVSTFTEDLAFEGFAIYSSLPAAAIPTLSEWGMIIFSLLLGSYAVWYMRKQSHKGSMA